MSDIEVFIKARLAEEEADARLSCGAVHPQYDVYHPEGHENPAIFARCAALRKLVALHESFPKVGGGDPDDEPALWFKHVAAMLRLRPDGTQHPDWKEEWNVSG